ncbi:hypothetical protein F4778DRAFT_765131 [Xylariomycetidae sp. FL2044]|nr:hypothetical protein F4778DRAFT_765131 [Xylariomycetidae sp. FL2044]
MRHVSLANFSPAEPGQPVTKRELVDDVDNLIQAYNISARGENPHPELTGEDEISADAFHAIQRWIDRNQPDAMAIITPPRLGRFKDLTRYIYGRMASELDGRVLAVYHRAPLLRDFKSKKYPSAHARTKDITMSFLLGLIRAMLAVLPDGRCARGHGIRREMGVVAEYWGAEPLETWDWPRLAESFWGRPANWAKQMQQETMDLAGPGGYLRDEHLLAALHVVTLLMLELGPHIAFFLDGGTDVLEEHCDPVVFVQLVSEINRYTGANKIWISSYEEEEEATADRDRSMLTEHWRDDRGSFLKFFGFNLTSSSSSSSLRLGEIELREPSRTVSEMPPVFDFDGEQMTAVAKQVPTEDDEEDEDEAAEVEQI